MKIAAFWIGFSLFLVMAIFFWMASHVPGPLDLRQAGNLMAALGVVFLFMQFLLSSRLKVLEDGFGLDRMLNYHRIFGRAALGLITLHFLSKIPYQQLSWAGLAMDFPSWLGLAALAGFFVTAALAAAHKKLRLAYHLWKNIHLLNYLLFPAALIHIFLSSRQDSLLFTLWIALALAYTALIFYRVYRIYQIRNNPYEVVEVKQEAGDIWSLFFRGPRIAYKPGQFLMIQLLRGGRLSSSHPFTISSSPTGNLLSITPKALGDFTSTIKDTKPGDKAFIDAPYGVFSYLNYEAKELVFIAGGIGITPFISMLRHMLDRGIEKKVTLFWANKREENLCFRDELEEMQRKLPAFTPVLVMSGQKDWPGEQGRVKAPLLKKYLPRLKGTHFFICGPPPMSRAVRAELEKLHVPRRNIHFEVFEL